MSAACVEGVVLDGAIMSALMRRDDYSVTGHLRWFILGPSFNSPYQDYG